MGQSVAPLGTQVRDIPEKRLQEQNFPVPTAKYWYDEIKRRYPLENKESVWTEKEVINGLRGDVKHPYPSIPQQYTELKESEKKLIAGRNFNHAIRRLRAEQYFLPPLIQEPFFEDEEIAELGYSMENHVRITPPYNQITISDPD